MHPNEELLRSQHSVLIELWSVFDEICKKHQIPYMLFAGTALGAVRHQGIIPWDDDLDVVMMRSDYERFMKIAEKDLNLDKYYLQKEYSDHWPMYFTKLRKNNTAFIEKYIPKDPLLHQGVFIDIFPCDNLSDNKFIRGLQFVSSKIIIAKSLDKRGYLTDSELKKVFMFICKFLPVKPFQAIVKLEKNNNTKGVHTFLGGAKDYKKNIYPRKWFTEKVDIAFCGKEAPVSKYYDKLLTRLYGDYMTPISNSERGGKIHAEIIDLERSYKEYVGIQKTIKFKEYTRSIR